MACLLSVMGAFFCLGSDGLAESPDGSGAAARFFDGTDALRIVVLAPAAADIVDKLGLKDCVVGVTSSVTDFPGASTVGTHRNPGIENIAALRPSLIIASARFSAELASRLGAELFIYEPRSLPAILEAITQLAERTGKTEQGEALVASLAAMMPQPVKTDRPTVVYEVRSTPLSLAPQESFLANLLESAGFHYAHQGVSAEVSPEYILENTPDFYIYQVGPMNKNPDPPLKRNGWRGMGACIWKVDELAFARPNTGSFALVAALTAILADDDPCEAGKSIFAGQ